MGMIDISAKPIVKRRAEAEGIIHLTEKTITEIKAGRIKKGDPLLVAEVAAMQAAKQTHILIPHCHQIPIEAVQIHFTINKTSITAQCRVSAQARTGVEMEALVGVSIWSSIWKRTLRVNTRKPGLKASE